MGRLLVDHQLKSDRVSRINISLGSDDIGEIKREFNITSVAVVFEATRYIIKLYHNRQHKKYTVRESIKEVV